MEQPSTKKAKIGGASSGVIIIDPSAFYNQNIKQPREQYTLPPLGKDFFLKTPKPVAPATMRTLTTLAPPPAIVQVPPLYITKNQNRKELNATSPHQAKHAPQLSQSKQIKLLGKPTQPGNKALVKQSNSQPNQPAKEIAHNPLLNHSNAPAEQSTQQPIPKQSIIQANQSAHESSLPLKTSNLPTKEQTNLPSQGSVKPMPDRSQFQYIEFINEALFDSEELSRNQFISVADSDDEVSALEDETFEYVLQIDKTHSVATETERIEYGSNGVQTNEAYEGRINCGFVNVSKYGPDKYFNLRCFYCDTEYPISFWSEFSDHVIETHAGLEKAFAENNTKSITNEINYINDSDSSEGVEDLPPLNLFVNLIDNERNLLLQSQQQETKLPVVEKHDESFKELLPEDFDDGDESDSGSEREKYYMSVEKYYPNIDHNYSQNSLNSTMKLMKEAKAVDEIIFGKTSRDIVLDFLDHLKGFHNLWYSRSNASLSYDNELLDLMNIMADKWGLNLKGGRLRRNLENIKAWFIGMTVSKEESGDKFFQHKFIEYYNKCAEYLPTGNTSKLQKVLCDLCDRFCFDLIGLQLHKYRKHNIGQLPYGCNKCDKRFDYVHKLRNHLRKHTVAPVVRRYVPPKILTPPEPDLTCAECNENFTIWSDFKRHLEIHPKGDCPYACEDCGNRFKTAALRGAHRKRHQEPAFQCELCPKKFYFAYHFQQHMNGHQGIKNYVCEWCGKMFTHQKIFNEHVQYVHLGRGFCKICNRYYNKSCIFSKHLRTMHRPLIGTIEELTKRRRGRCKGGSRKGKGTGPRLSTRKYTYVTDPVTQKRRLLCPNCDKSYYQYDSLYSHVKKVHGCSVPGYHKRVTGNKKLSKSSKKKGNKATPDKVLNTEAEATTAVNSIIENASLKFDNPIDQRTSVDLSSRTCTTTDEKNAAGSSSAVENDIKYGKNVTSMTFEKFIGEIAISNNFILQSPSSLPTLIDAEDRSLGALGQSPEKPETVSGLKMDDYGAIDYEFMLNGSSVLNF